MTQKPWLAHHRLNINALRSRSCDRHSASTSAAAAVAMEMNRSATTADVRDYVSCERTTGQSLNSHLIYSRPNSRLSLISQWLSMHADQFASRRLELRISWLCNSQTRRVLYTAPSWLRVTVVRNVARTNAASMIQFLGDAVIPRPIRRSAAMSRLVRQMSLSVFAYRIVNAVEAGRTLVTRPSVPQCQKSKCVSSLTITPVSQ